MFRSGKLKIKEFVGANNRPLTLKALSAKSSLVTGRSVPKPKLTQAQWATNLTTAEKNAIEYWIGGYQGVPNIKRWEMGLKTNIEGKLFTTKEKEILKTWDSALAKAPKFQGEVYRGLGLKNPDELAEYGKGKIIDFKSSTSASTTKRTTESFMHFAESYDNIPVQLVVETKTGVQLGSLGPLSGQREVLLRQGFKYKVTNKLEWVNDLSFKKTKGYYRVKLKETTSRTIR